MELRHTFVLLFVILIFSLSSAASVGRGRSKSSGRIFTGALQSFIDSVPWLPVEFSVSDTFSGIGSAWNYMTSQLGSFMGSGESKPRKRKKSRDKKKYVLPKIKNDKEMGIRPDPFPGEEPQYLIPMAKINIL